MMTRTLRLLTIWLSFTLHASLRYAFVRALDIHHIPLRPLSAVLNFPLCLTFRCARCVHSPLCSLSAVLTFRCARTPAVLNLPLCSLSAVFTLRCAHFRCADFILTMRLFC